MIYYKVMFSKHKNKGKGVGKGQSNRHKNERRNRNTETSYGSRSRVSSNSSSTSSTPNVNRNDFSRIHNFQEQHKCSTMKIPNTLLPRTFSREDPLMADLLWTNVQPSDECIPRFSKEFRDSLPKDEVVESPKISKKQNTDMNYPNPHAKDTIAANQSIREYPRTCHPIEGQRDSTKYNRKRDDPLMSDLMWEKVDTDDECIPRMKQSGVSSEDETSYIDDDNSYSSSICDPFKNNELEWSNSSRIKKYTQTDNITDKNIPNAAQKSAPSKSSRKTKRSRKRNQNLTHVVIEEETSTSSTSLSTPTKMSRQHNLDATKKVSELLTQQLSIMWCLKEFEPNSSYKLADSNEKKNILGQVIQQGRDIYFQPTLNASSESKRDNSSTSRSDITRRSKKEVKNDLEIGEIESDTTSISVDMSAGTHHIKKKKKSKKLKRRNVSKRTKKSGRSGNACKSRSMSNKDNDSLNIRHSRNRYLNNRSSRQKEYICSREGNDTSSYDEELFVPKPVISVHRNSQFGSSLNDRPRSTHRSIQCKRGNRRLLHRKNHDHADIDSSPESYRNVLIPPMIPQCMKEKFLNEKVFESNEEKHLENNKGDTTKSKRSNSSLDERPECNYYLRRITPNTRCNDTKWISVEREHIL